MRRKSTCKKRACRTVDENVCNNIKDCGPFSFACNGIKNVCKTVTKTVCDGACQSYNYVMVPVTNTVYTAGDCSAQGLKEIAKNVRCAKHLPKCAGTGVCYASDPVKVAGSGLKCVSGIISPSKECLKENKFI